MADSPASGVQLAQQSRTDHAIERVETSEFPEGTVVGEMQAGYTFHDRVLRPAMVRVATAPEPRSAHALKRDN